MMGGMTKVTSPAESTDGALVVAFQHKTWSTIEVLEACRSLTPEQLAAAVPGTYGSIHATLQHLVGSDESYLFKLTGVRHFPELHDENDPPPLPELIERTARAGTGWSDLAARPDQHLREVVTRDGWRTQAVILLVQALHHANEHRSQVLTIIGARGFDLPGIDISEDFDAWHHGIHTGLMVRVEPDPETGG
jgi:uncharacterized damage-inducible protein DinB